MIIKIVILMLLYVRSIMVFTLEEVNLETEFVCNSCRVILAVEFFEKQGGIKHLHLP